MISVEEAQERLLSLVAGLESETVDLRSAAGRVLAHEVAATRDQPPFASSAMDGYAVADRAPEAGAIYEVIGESAAGHRYVGALTGKEAVRIFTGAPVPEGTQKIIIQEDVERQNAHIILKDNFDTELYIRPAGSDFAIGHKISGRKYLTPSDIALAASMNIPRLSVTRKPSVALISTGDELVMPGQQPNQDQIIASNTFGLAALLEKHGASVRILPIARDTLASLKTVFNLIGQADLIVTIGGASVGDYDLVTDAAQDLGLVQNFYKVAMRPGKPLMAGQFGNTPMVGLPGNPVSAMVCGSVFLVPMVKKMLGYRHPLPEVLRARLCAPAGKNGPRTHYCRSFVNDAGLTIADRQDSSLLSVLADANCLAIRAPDAPEAEKGDEIDYILI